jgi:hypothetical protein
MDWNTGLLTIFFSCRTAEMPHTGNHAIVCIVCVCTTGRIKIAGLRGEGSSKDCAIVLSDDEFEGGEVLAVEGSPLKH